MQKKVDWNKINSIFGKVVFVALLLNVLVFPVVSHISYRLVLILTNIIEYGFCLLTIIYILFKFLSCDMKLHKSILILLFLFLYSTLIFLLFSKKNVESFGLILKIFECFCFYVIAQIEIKNKVRLNILFITIVVSIALLFVSSILYNIKTPENLVQAFSGGKYRLGNLESQANGYALYCFYLCVVFILIYSLNGNKYCLLLPLLPTIICIGTQSKKGILICFVITIFSLLLFIKCIKNATLRNVLFVLLPCAIFTLVLVVILKTNLFARFFKKGDDSTITRIMMYRYLFLDFDISFLIGKGTNSFKTFFYLNNGTELVFHSTIGDTLFSYGLIGFLLWVYFIFAVYLRKKNDGKKTWVIFMFIMLICQILTDLTSTIWYVPFSFIVLALLTNDKLFKYPMKDNKVAEPQEDYTWIEI